MRPGLGSIGIDRLLAVCYKQRDQIFMRLDKRNLENLDDPTAAIYREKSPRERLQIAFGLWSLAKSILVNSMRSLHPDWDEKKIQEEAARRISHGAV